MHHPSIKKSLHGSGNGQTGLSRGFTNDMGLSYEVTYNMFEPVGVLVDAVGLPIDLMDVIGVLVDPWASR